jgi:TatD DNase family protein
MASCAHAHPADLAACLPGAEEERRRLSLAVAACACNRQDFEYQETLAENARRDGGPPMAACFALHPQLPAGEKFPGEFRAGMEESLALLDSLAEEGRLRAIGETGFDLYDEKMRSTETIQEELFVRQLETALRRDLPLVLHIRRAMHKVFANAGALRKLPAVVFHSYSGTLGEGEALLRRGINAYFAFGAAITANHREAMRACAALPRDRLLTETDAPYQPRQGETISRWADVPITLRVMAELRDETETAEALEAVIDANWRRIFGYDIIEG